ncbi:MAG: fibronectin type III domain-containing protein [Metallibacterium sp.]
MAKTKWFKYKKLDTADKVTIGVIGGVLLAEILFGDKFKVGQGLASEIYSTCEPGFGYDIQKASCVPVSAGAGSAPTSCPSGYTLTNGDCISNVTASATTVASSPSNVSVSASSGNNVILSWSAAPNAVSYDIYQSSSSNGTYTMIASNITGTTYTVSGLSSGQTYYFEVGAVNSSGSIVDSSPISFTMPVSSQSLTFSGTITNSSQYNLPQFTASNDSIIAGGTNTTSGVPYWAGVITYSGGSFNGAWTVNGDPVIQGSGDTISGNGITASITSGSTTNTGVYSGSITYSNGSFSGTIYVSANGGAQTAVLTGSSNYIIGQGSLAGSIQETSATADTASALTSVITNLAALVAGTCQYGTLASGNCVDPSQFSGQYSSQIVTGMNLGGCCNWWTKGASSESWSVQSISGSNAIINLNRLGTITLPISSLITAAQNGTLVDLPTSAASSSVQQQISAWGHVGSPFGSLVVQSAGSGIAVPASTCPSGYTSSNGVCLSNP